MVTIVKNDELNVNEIKGLAVIDFSATWCGPCKMLKPIFDEVSEELKDSVKFFNADVDQNSSLSDEFNITNIPALVVVKDGQVIDTLIGFKPKEALKAELERYL